MLVEMRSRRSFSGRDYPAKPTRGCQFTSEARSLTQIVCRKRTSDEGVDASSSCTSHESRLTRPKSVMRWVGVWGQELHPNPLLPLQAFTKLQPLSVPLKPRTLPEANPISTLSSKTPVPLPEFLMKSSHASLKPPSSSEVGTNVFEALTKDSVPHEAKIDTVLPSKAPLKPYKSFDALAKPKVETTNKIVHKELEPQLKVEAQENLPSSLVVSKNPMTEISLLMKPLEPREAFGKGERTGNVISIQPKLSEALGKPDLYSDVKSVTLNPNPLTHGEALFKASRFHLTNEASTISPIKTPADIQIDEALKGLLASYKAFTKSILLKSLKTLPILSNAILPSPASVEISKSATPETSNAEMKSLVKGNVTEKPSIYSKTQLKFESHEAFPNSYTNSEALVKTESSPQLFAKPFHVSEEPAKPIVSSEVALKFSDHSQVAVEPIEKSEAPTTPDYISEVSMKPTENTNEDPTPPNYIREALMKSTEETEILTMLSVTNKVTSKPTKKTETQILPNHTREASVKPAAKTDLQTTQDNTSEASVIPTEKTEISPILSGARQASIKSSEKMKISTAMNASMMQIQKTEEQTRLNNSLEGTMKPTEETKVQTIYKSKSKPMMVTEGSVTPDDISMKPDDKSKPSLTIEHIHIREALLKPKEKIKVPATQNVTSESSVKSSKNTEASGMSNDTQEASMKQRQRIYSQTTPDYTEETEALAMHNSNSEAPLKPIMVTEGTMTLDDASEASMKPNDKSITSITLEHILVHEALMKPKEKTEDPATLNVSSEAPVKSIKNTEAQRMSNDAQEASMKPTETISTQATPDYAEETEAPTTHDSLSEAQVKQIIVTETITQTGEHEVQVKPNYVTEIPTTIYYTRKATMKPIEINEAYSTTLNYTHYATVKPTEFNEEPATLTSTRKHLMKPTEITEASKTLHNTLEAAMKLPQMTEGPATPDDTWEVPLKPIKMTETATMSNYTREASRKPRYVTKTPTMLDSKAFKPSISNIREPQMKPKEMTEASKKNDTNDIPVKPKEITEASMKKDDSSDVSMKPAEMIEVSTMPNDTSEALMKSEKTTEISTKPEEISEPPAKAREMTEAPTAPYHKHEAQMKPEGITQTSTKTNHVTNPQIKPKEMTKATATHDNNEVPLKSTNIIKVPATLAYRSETSLIPTEVTETQTTLEYSSEASVKSPGITETPTTLDDSREAPVKLIQKTEAEVQTNDTRKASMTSTEKMDAQTQEYISGPLKPTAVPKPLTTSSEASVKLATLDHSFLKLLVNSKEDFKPVKAQDSFTNPFTESETLLKTLKPHKDYLPTNNEAAMRPVSNNLHEDRVTPSKFHKTLALSPVTLEPLLQTSELSEASIRTQTPRQTSSTPQTTTINTTKRLFPSNETPMNHYYTVSPPPEVILRASVTPEPILKLTTHPYVQTEFQKLHTKKIHTHATSTPQHLRLLRRYMKPSSPIEAFATPPTPPNIKRPYENPMNLRNN
ncbi:hypothetical protein E2C01_020522 [Portunus trituberculatus]|uniref:Uncharacterized protein n=1 Tax=Portunus trituberculatus TaxID=210409 RepID=A0A5B7E297_PORTR|nr:hypothetical protein [Portunus trituberculatus]